MSKRKSTLNASGEKNSIRRKKLQELFTRYEEKEDTTNKKFTQYFEPEKEQFFTMLKAYNKEKEEEQKRIEAVDKKDEVKQKDEVNKKDDEKPPKLKKTFRIQISENSKPKTEPEKNELSTLQKQEQILSINEGIMRDVLEDKWDKIFLEEGCLEDVLNWDLSNKNFEICCEQTTEADFSQNIFFKCSQDNNGSFKM